MKFKKRYIIIPIVILLIILLGIVIFIKLDRDYLDINGDREYNGRKDEDINISDEEEDNTGVVPDE